jgi:hypothetical protein
MAARVLFGLVRKPGRWFNGRGYVAGELPGGLVTTNGAPARREVEARERRSRTVAATTFSAADGTYRIGHLDPALEFDIIGRDHTGTFNDVIVSRVRPVALES